LRLADHLDLSHKQRIQSMECRVRNGHVVLQLRAPKDVDLEQWAAERVAEVFHQIYDRPLVVAKARG
jgi:hypothetical protein